MKKFPRPEILLVDDTKSDINLIRIILEEEGFEGDLQVVSQGEEALDFVFCRDKYAGRSSSAVPDLIFLDLHMPRMNGYKVIEVLKEHPKTVSIPIIVLSALESDEDLCHCYSMGVGGYIVKPTGFEVFKDKILGTLKFWLQDAVH